MPPVLGYVEGAVSVFSGLFGNPKDEARKAEARNLRDAALAGNDCAYWKLRCLAGYNDENTRANAKRCGHFTADELARGTPCGYATGEAQAYAKTMVAEVDTRRNVATGAAVVTAGAAKVGTEADAPTYLGTTGTLVGQSLGLPGIPPVVLLGGLAVLAFVLLKGR